MPGAKSATGLRDRQKARRRTAIIDAAQRLFREHGYQATSMEAIAETAEVGVATVYNYFGTKGALLAEMLRPEFDALYAKGARLLAAADPDPTRGILQLIDIYRHFRDDPESRNLLSAIIGPGLSAEPVLDELSENAEAQVKAQLDALLAHYQSAGLIRPGIDIHDVSIIVFSVFNQRWIEYVTQQSVSYEDMSNAMDRQIRLLIDALRSSRRTRSRR